MGCGKDDPVKPLLPAAPPRYFTQSAPESTVLNYTLAWERRDSTMIDSVMADDYTGSSVDMSDPSSGTLTFTKSDETRALGRFQLDSRIRSIEILFSEPSTWTRFHDLADPVGWVTLTIPQSSIRVFWVNGMDAVAHTQLEFTVEAIASASDTTWKIVRWSEVHQ
jgi:hypothetical protein